MILTTLKASLIDLLLPNRCPGCDGFLSAGELLCAACEESIRLPEDAFCRICGMVICKCRQQLPIYDRALVCTRYLHDREDPAVRAIWALKNSQNTNFARYSAKILADRIRRDTNPVTYDCVTAVPMHRTKQRIRGYNQAELIAKALAQELDIPYRGRLLYKDRSRHAQHTLRAKERTRNTASFHAYDVPLDGMHILLCDDVLTTGATMNRCASLLKANGAVHVTAIAAAATCYSESNPQNSSC